jgi:hypothetical protein
LSKNNRIAIELWHAMGFRPPRLSIGRKAKCGSKGSIF